MRRQKRGPAELQLLVRTRPIEPLTCMIEKGIQPRAAFSVEGSPGVSVTQNYLII